jgi:predicted MFS family arabinose efflux permease
MKMTMPEKINKTGGIARSLLLLTNPAFLRLWLIGGLSGVVRWLEMLAVGIYVFDVTQSPLQVTFYALLRMLPLALFGAFAGAIADRLSPRLVLATGLTAMLATTLTLGALAVSDHLQLWHIAIGALLNGIFWATDYPTRRTMLSVIAGVDQIATAMGLDTATNSTTKAIGPAAGGALLALLGMQGVYFLGATLYGFSLLLLIGVTVEGTKSARHAMSFLRGIGQSISMVRRDRTLQSALAITIIFNVWGFPYLSMIPVIGRDDLMLNEANIGLLMSAEGIGGLLATLTIACFAQSWMYRRIYAYGLLLCLAMVITFTMASSPLLAGLCVLLAGVGAGCFSAMQSTIILLSAPAEQRGQLMGLLVVCIGTGPIGFLHLGLLADWLGATEAVSLIAVEGIMMLAITLLIWPEATKT